MVALQPEKAQAAFHEQQAWQYEQENLKAQEMDYEADAAAKEGAASASLAHTHRQTRALWDGWADQAWGHRDHQHLACLKCPSWVGLELEVQGQLGIQELPWGLRLRNGP